VRYTLEVGGTLPAVWVYQRPAYPAPQMPSAPLPRALARLAVTAALLGCDVTFGRGSYRYPGAACDADWPRAAAAPLPLGNSLRFAVGHLGDVHHD